MSQKFHWGFTRFIALSLRHFVGVATLLAVGTVASNSTYSLGWAFYEVGSEQLRVAITGGPANQGAATPPVGVTVNAVPASTLVPASG